MNANSCEFLCTYKENGGPLMYGAALEGATIDILGFNEVDTTLPGYFSEFVSVNTSEAASERSAAVLQYSNSSILMTTQNEVEFAEIKEIDVEILSLDLILDGTSIFIAPTIRNNSSEVLESMQFSGDWFSSICLFRTLKTYDNLGIQPGETRRLDSFNMQPIDRIDDEYSARLMLNTANDFPIKQGNTRDTIATAIFSSTKEAKTRTTSVYPNPAMSNVEVKLEAGERIQEVRAMDFRGRNLGSIPFSGSNLDVSMLVTGNYLLELRLFGEQVLYVNLMKE